MSPRPKPPKPDTQRAVRAVLAAAAAERRTLPLLRIDDEVVVHDQRAAGVERARRVLTLTDA